MTRTPTKQPTNADLQKAFDRRHTKDDRDFQDESRLVNGEMVAFKAETEGKLADIHTKVEALEMKLDDVATKDDIKELKDFMEKVNIGVGIFTFSFKNARNIGSFIVLIIGVYLLVKIGIAGAVAWIIHR